jgi:hypothetical protein
VPLDRQWGTAADAILARPIIELVKTGERDPEVLCERALASFLSRRPIASSPPVDGRTER